MDPHALERCRIFLDRMRQYDAVQVAKQGELIEVKIGISVPRRRKSYPRKPITSYSPKARLRNLKMLARVDWRAAGCAVLVTVTYPDAQVHRTMRQRTQDRSVLLRDMERHMGVPIHGFWRVEWIDRKSGSYVGEILPHMHMLWLGMHGVPKEVLRRTWMRIIGAEEKTQVDVRLVRSAEHAAIYAAKYMAKTSDHSILDYVPYLNKTGRHHGYSRKSLIPMCPAASYDSLTLPQLECLVAHGAMWLTHVELDDPRSFSLFGAKARVLWQKIEALDLTDETQLDTL